MNTSKQQVKVIIVKIRSWIANKLIKLAWKIRPKEEKHLMNMIEDSFIYGTGVIRINPEEMFKKEKI